MKNRVPTICLTLAMIRGSAAFGADTSTSQKDPFTAQQRKYWAFQSIKRPEVPHASGKNTAANPIAAFIHAKIQSDGFKPNPSADRETLGVRVNADTAGLAPTPAQMGALVHAQSSHRCRRP